MQEKGLKPNVVTYTMLIAAYGQVGNLAECEKLYEEMQIKGIRPTDPTFNTMAAVLGRERNIDISVVEKGLFVSTFLLPLLS
jgi:pentatricopeptide repeat protein